jgi:integrase
MPPERNPRRPEKVPGHPGIYHKGSTYIDTWKERGKSRSRSYRTLTAAARGRAQRIAGGNRPASRERFDRYARRWIDSYRGRTKRGLDEGTRDEYRSIIETWLIPHFRHTALGEIGPKAVRDFIDHLCESKNRAEQPLAAATIRWIMVPLKAMLAEAYEDELVPVDASRVRIVIPDRTRGRRRPKTMNRHQTVAVQNALPARYRLLFLLLACTGLRISEALGLQWRDLEQTADGPVCAVRRQFYRGQLKDHPKSEAGDRLVAIVPALARELTRHRASTEHAAPTDPVFATKFGTHISAHNIRRMLRPIVADLGLPWVTPHVFRHSLATALRDAGHDANAIARVLGHTDPGFTQRTYIHVPHVVRFDEVFSRREDNPEDNPAAESGRIVGHD